MTSCKDGGSNEGAADGTGIAAGIFAVSFFAIVLRFGAALRFDAVFLAGFLACALLVAAFFAFAFLRAGAVFFFAVFLLDFFLADFFLTLDFFAMATLPVMPRTKAACPHDRRSCPHHSSCRRLLNQK